MPTFEFPDPLPADRLVSELVVKAAVVVDAGGVPWPMLHFNGRDVYDQALPTWMYAGDEDAMKRLVGLVTDMAALAVRRA